MPVRGNLALVGRQVERDLRLERIGILKFVDKNAPEACLGGVADLGVVAQQVARPRQQIVEVSRPVRAALTRTFEYEIAHEAQQCRECGGVVSVEHLSNERVDALQSLAG